MRWTHLYDGVVMSKTVKLTGDAGERGVSSELAAVSSKPFFCDACQKLVHRLVTGGSSAGDFIR